MLYLLSLLCYLGAYFKFLPNSQPQTGIGLIRWSHASNASLTFAPVLLRGSLQSEYQYEQQPGSLHLMVQLFGCFAYILSFASLQSECQYEQQRG